MSSFIVIISVFISKILWGQIYLPYNGESEIYGEYYKYKFSIYHPAIGSLSAISMAWGIDRGAYLNLVLFFLILFLSLRRDLKKSSLILLGAITSWIIFSPHS